MDNGFDPQGDHIGHLMNVILIFHPLHQLVFEIWLREWQRNTFALHLLPVLPLLIHNACKRHAFAEPLVSRFFPSRVP